MYKDIAVTLDPRPSTELRVAAAAALARAHGARLVGIDMTVSFDFDGRWRTRAAHVREVFEDVVSGTGIQGRYRRIAMGNILSMAAFHCVDLIVTGSLASDEADDGPRTGVLERVILSSGVPALSLPAGWAMPSIPSVSVVIAWNGSREATRSVHDALPLLRQAGNVIVFACSDNGGPTPAGVTDGLLDHLTRHGIEAKAYTWPDLGDDTPVDALFEYLTAQNADLVVAGAFGHARWLRSLFKSTTEALLRHPRMPVFLSH